jgi:soluble lytic murein transglycosylase-like protein
LISGAHLRAAGWRALGALGQGSARLPSLGLAAGLFALLVLPRPVPAAPPSLNPPEPLIEASSPSAPTTGPVAQVDEVLARKAGGLGLQLRHQLAQAIVEEAQAARLDPWMVLAVMRVESEFDEDATSIRGARGLMQVRPTTLAFVAQREGLKLPIEEIQRDPVLSARLAVRYLGRLVVAFKGNLDLALMAYNAGPHRLNTLLIDGGDLAPFQGYPRAVRRAWQRLLARPSTDDLAVAERSSDQLARE